MKKWKIALPDTVHLGYQTIAVKPWDLEEAQGVYMSDRPEIRIKESLSDRETLNTLIHEILHASVYCYGIKQEFKDGDHEERVVNVLGNALTEIFTRNPRVIDWIHKNAKS